MLRSSMWNTKRQFHLCVVLVLVVNSIFYLARYRDAQSFQAQPVFGLDTASGSSQESSCPEYGSYASAPHDPRTGGFFDLPYQRPTQECRKVILSEVEETIEEMKSIIKDPDLFRLFENCFPNTLDTAISWTGFAQGDSEQELTFITTGDIEAMWLRDSANQLQSYVSILRPNSSSGSLASLFRGAINLQARYISASPHCNAFQAPKEAGLHIFNRFSSGDSVMPPYDPSIVFECKYELDSLAAFLQLSYDYYSRTHDAEFFTRFAWKAAVERLMEVVDELTGGTYADDGMVNDAPYQFTRHTSVATETLANNGLGSPVKGKTGMVRSAFRPSDDSCTYQLFVPANMMLARYLASCAEIMEPMDSHLARKMTTFAGNIRRGIEKYGRVKHPEFGEMYAYEVDGFGSSNLMDDANLPSLLSAPLMSYLPATDPIYLATRKFIFSKENPYYMHGSVINGTGGPHIGPGMAWPMSLIVYIMTSDDDKEIADLLRQLLSSTDKLGLMHESVNVYNPKIWTRGWFSWANGLFGQMLLDLRERKPHILATGF